MTSMLQWSRRRSWLCTSLAVLVSAALEGCSSASGPSETPDLYSGRYDPANHTFDLRHATRAVRSAGIDLVSGTAWTDSALQVHVLVSLRSSRPESGLGPRGIQVDAIMPASVWPLNAGCARPAPNDIPPLCVFWHFDSYGADHMLDPGETSVPVEWIFDDPGDAPFDFAARLWWPHG